MVGEGKHGREKEEGVEKTYMLNESTLVLEGVTLAEMVQPVVEMLVDFAGSAIFHQKATEDAETAHPHHLAISRHSSSAWIHRMGKFLSPNDPSRPSNHAALS